jgi:hypothetical protein
VEYDGEPHGLLVTKKVDVIADVTAFLTDSNERMGDDRARGFPEPMLTAPIV